MWMGSHYVQQKLEAAQLQCQNLIFAHISFMVVFRYIFRFGCYSIDLIAYQSFEHSLEMKFLEFCPSLRTPLATCLGLHIRFEIQEKHKYHAAEKNFPFGLVVVHSNKPYFQVQYPR